MHVLLSSTTHLFTNLTYISFAVDLTCLSTTRDVVFNATGTPVLAKSLEDAASGAKSGAGTLGLELTASLPAVSTIANDRTHPSFTTVHLTCEHSLPQQLLLTLPYLLPCLSSPLVGS
jgi:hypothetical protein